MHAGRGKAGCVANRHNKPFRIRRAFVTHLADVRADDGVHKAVQITDLTICRTKLCNHDAINVANASGLRVREVQLKALPYSGYGNERHRVVMEDGFMYTVRNEIGTQRLRCFQQRFIRKVEYRKDRARPASSELDP